MGNFEGVRKAVTRDVPEIQKLVNDHAQKGLMLGLSLSEIYEQLRDFNVWEREGAVVGTCALRIHWDDLAEIRSLAVREDACRRGIGSGLVRTALGEAAEMGVRRVFALTYQGPFFGRLGFRRVEKAELPHKVWTDCLKCVKFPGCDEEAYLMEMGGAP